MPSEIKTSGSDKAILKIKYESLAFASLCYLIIPLAIFAIGWTKPAVSIPCTILMVFAHFLGSKRSIAASKIERSTSYFSVRPIALAVLLLAPLAFLLVSGTGGYGYQTSDWLKHNAILKCLIEEPWPVILQIQGQATPLVYYIGYYLPASLVGKLFGWFWANQFLLLWSYLGLILSIMWFCVFVGKARFATFFLFFVFSGLDITGCWLIHRYFENASCSTDHIEWWAQLWQYSSNGTLIFWVPQHAYAAWILVSLILYDSLYLGRKDRMAFIWSLSPIQSTFVAIGLIPFLIADFFSDQSSLKQRLQAYLSTSSISALIMIAIQGSYFMSRLANSGSVVARSSIPAGHIFNFVDTRSFLSVVLAIFLFVFLEWGLFLIVALISHQSSLSRVAFGHTLAAAITLSLLPFLKYGQYNDLAMRSSIPSLFFIAVLLGRALANLTTHKWLVWSSIALLALGSLTPGIEVLRHLRMMSRDNRYIYLVTLQATPGLIETNRERNKRDHPRDWFLTQYLGSSNSFFFRVLAR